jgi:hypothetical protein
MDTSKYTVLKKTYSALLGNYDSTLSGFGLDPFPTYTSLSGVVTFIIFVFASLLLQVTMLNLLISIMGGTYNRITK